MKKVALLSCVILVSCFAKAQNDVDALRYSRLDFGGTARFNAMSGAFGALGGDFSVCSTNPAGIAIFRKSEITFSPSLFQSRTSSTFGGNATDDNKFNFNFGNCGLVLAGNDEKNENDWRGFALGIGYNRSSNFHNRILVEGVNNRSSFVDLWLSSASGLDTNSFDQFGAGLAYTTGLIRQYTSSPGQYYGIIEAPYGETQTKSVETRGSVGETVFTIGGNYRDKFYLGGTFGFPHVRYTEESSHTETVKNDTVYDLESFTYGNDIQTTGSGFNFKFGMILKPVEWIRIGAAVHSPTFFRLSDQYSNQLDVKYSYGSYTANSPNGSYDYTLTTPTKGVGSIAFIYKSFGLISVDYEFVDYSSARLRSPGYKFTNENTAIRNKYTAAGNLRAGMEIKLNPFSLRAGYARYGKPYKNTSVNTGGDKQSFSFGLGYRGDGIYVDAAYVYSLMDEDYFLYDPTIIDASKNSVTTSTIMFTVGIKY
jgi:hypothetical protein